MISGFGFRVSGCRLEVWGVGCCIRKGVELSATLNPQSTFPQTLNYRRPKALPDEVAHPYRGTSLIKKRLLLGAYSRPVPRALRRSWVEGAVSYERGTPVPLTPTLTSYLSPLHPFTPSLTPYTLHPALDTLHPPPYALHPQTPKQSERWGGAGTLLCKAVFISHNVLIRWF